MSTRRAKTQPLQPHDAAPPDAGELSEIGAPSAADSQNDRAHTRRHRLQPDVDAQQAELALQARNQALATVNAISDSLYTSLDYTAVIERATQGMMRYSGSPSVGVLALEEDGKHLRCECHRGLEEAANEPLIAMGMRVPLHSGGMSILCLERRDVIWCEDATRDPRVYAAARQALAAAGWRGMVYVPLLAHGRGLGVMILLFHESLTLNDLELETLRTIGKTVGLAMSHAQHVTRLRAEIQQREAADRKRRELEAQLRQSQRLEMIGTLTGGLAHDFNNILTPIVGYTEMALSTLRAHAGHQPPPSFNLELRSDLEQVAAAARQAQGLVARLLTFSRQHPERPRTPVRLDEVARDALELLRASLPATVRIEAHLDDGTPPVLADAVQLHQVIMNLCANAAQAMGAGGGLLRVDVRPASEQEAMLIVTDTGPGMDEATLSRVFEPFFTTKQVGEGTGLGLSVAHGIVRSHQGRIQATSAPGQGSRFEVLLPAGRLVQATPEAPGEAHTRGTERVLLVDDDAVVLRTTARILGRQGYRVTAYGSGSEALDALYRQPDGFDLLMCDQTMPQMTGLELAAAARVVRPRLPVILVTGYSDIVNADNYASFGIDRLLSKPASPTDVGRAIRQVMDAARCRP